MLLESHEEDRQQRRMNPLEGPFKHTVQLGSISDDPPFTISGGKANHDLLGNLKKESFGEGVILYEI